MLRRSSKVRQVVTVAVADVGIWFSGKIKAAKDVVEKSRTFLAKEKPSFSHVPVLEVLPRLCQLLCLTLDSNLVKKEALKNFFKTHVVPSYDVKLK